MRTGQAVLYRILKPAVTSDKIPSVVTLSLFRFPGIKRDGPWPGKILGRVAEATHATVFCCQTVLQFCFQAAGIQDRAAHTYTT